MTQKTKLLAELQEVIDQAKQNKNFQMLCTMSFLYGKIKGGYYD